MMPLLLVAEQLQGEYAFLYDSGEPLGMKETELEEVFRAVWDGVLMMGTQRGSLKGNIGIKKLLFEIKNRKDRKILTK